MRKMDFRGKKEREGGGSHLERDGPCGWRWRDWFFLIVHPGGEIPQTPFFFYDF
jgi:hypothetical protein